MNTPKTSQAAQNTFSDGLVMDFNDLVSPASALTNCLNGTTITYNGNEFVLLNDMGNGRVETAYLPAGYVPVGMKEEGGIIYVASVNPSTGKCQLGSFPSPERNITTKDNKGTSNVLILGLINKGLTEYPYLAIADQTIRSGDKFCLNISNLNKDIASKIITDCYSRALNKKKALTLALAVQDSENNYRILTNLKRFVQEERGSEITSKKASSETDGYFLYFNVNDENKLSQLLHQVYNNKVFGQIYLICTFNNIDDFETSFNCKSDSNTVTATATFEYQYNCPDGFYAPDSKKKCRIKYPDSNICYIEAPDNLEFIESNSDDDIYTIAEESEIESNYGADYRRSILGTHLNFKYNGTKEVDMYIPFNKIYLPNYEIGNSSYTIFDSADYNNITAPKYDEATLLYKFTLKVPLDLTHILNLNGSLPEVTYTVTPYMNYGIADLSSKALTGTINLAKINTGEINLVGWKYMYQDDVTYITWTVEDYHFETDIISDFKFSFYAIVPGASLTKADLVYEISPKRSYNGSFTEELDSELVPQTMYLVKITYDKSGQEVILDYRWLLTSDLYNDKYADTTILDYINLDQLTCTPEFDISCDINVVDNTSISQSGKYISPNNSGNNYSLIKTESYECQFVTYGSFSIPAKYPFNKLNTTLSFINDKDGNPTYMYTYKYEVGNNDFEAQDDAIMAKRFTEGGLYSDDNLTDELIPSMTIWMGSHSSGKDYTYIRYRSHIYTNGDRTKDEYEYSTYEENKVYYLDDNWDTVTRILDKICGTPAGNAPKCAVICWESSPLNLYMYLVYNGEEYISLFATPHSTTRDYGFYKTYKELLTHISELNKVYKVDANLNTSSTVYVVPTANQSIQWKHNNEANFITKSYNAIPALDFDLVIVTPILTEPLNDSVEEGATPDDGSENTVFTRRSYNSLIDTLKSNCTSGSKAIEVLEKMKFTLNCSPENITPDNSNTIYKFALNTKTVNYTISYKGIVEEINKIQASIRNKTYAQVVNTNNETEEILDMYDSPMTSDALFWTRSEFGNLVPISTTGLGVDSNGFIVGNYTGYVKLTLDSTTTTSEFRVLHAGNKHSSASYKLGSIKTANLTRSI